MLQYYCTVLYSTVLYCTVLYCTVQYCTVLCSTHVEGAGQGDGGGGVPLEHDLHHNPRVGVREVATGEGGRGVVDDLERRRERGDEKEKNKRKEREGGGGRGAGEEGGGWQGGEGVEGEM